MPPFEVRYRKAHPRLPAFSISSSSSGRGIIFSIMLPIPSFNNHLHAITSPLNVIFTMLLSILRKAILIWLYMTVKVHCCLYAFWHQYSPFWTSWNGYAAVFPFCVKSSYSPLHKVKQAPPISLASPSSSS